MLLVSPGIFKRYAQEFPELDAQAKEKKLESWQLVQRAFEKLKVHRKTASSLNIWTCDVVGPRKSRQLRGYLLNSPDVLFSEPPFDNPSIRLVSETSDS